MESNGLPTEADVQFFRDNGYWIAPKRFDDDLLEQARAHLESLRREEYDKGDAPLSTYRAPDDGGRGLLQINNAWWADTVMERLATDPVMGQIAARLLVVAEVYIWHDQALYKPGGSGAAGNVGWHQDRGYWASSSTDDMITAWIAFDDVDEENGCMRVVPGSNRWGLLGENSFFDPDLAAQRNRMPLPEGATWRETPVSMKAGQVSFHHSVTLHGSGPNRSTRPRRSLAVHLMSGEARLVKGHGHNNEAIFGGEDGALFRGPRFPRLWPK